MSFWASLVGALGFGSQGEAKMTSAELALAMRGSGMSGSGANVTWQTALQVTTVLACVRVIAEGVAQVPWKLYQGGGVRTEAREHRIFDLLYRSPGNGQTSFEFRESLIFHAALTGNAFVRKLRVGSAREVAALELLEPARVRMKREQDGRVRYFYTPEGGTESEIIAAEMWHVRGPSWNTWMGMDATRLAREAVGLSIATEAAHADFHRNGARVSGFYSVPGSLSKDQFNALDEWISQFSQGGKRAGKPAILDRDAKFNNTQMTGVDAQHIETRKHQVEEICRAFRVMPIMVGQADKAATYASAEQMFIAHVVHTLMPWYERLEHSADNNLLTEAERRAGYYTKFTPNALLRGAAKDRADYYAKALGAGGTPAWMVQDEVRALEELDPKGGSAAELNPGSMGQQPPASGGSGA